MKVIFESAEKKLEYLNQFLEEQLWYIETLMKDIKNNQNKEAGQGVDHFKKDTLLKQNLETKYWTIQDVKSVIAGEL